MVAPDPGNISAQQASFGRLYSGMKSSERAQERHSRLVEAGFEVFGTVGYPGAKIKDLCQRAGLSERYFYESFQSREHLLTTVYDALSKKLMQEVVAAVTVPGMELRQSVRAGMAAVVNFMLDDPRIAQIILVEIVGVSPELESKRHRYLSDFAAESMRLLLLLSGIDQDHAQARQQGAPRIDSLAEALEFARLTAISMVGGVNNMLLDALLSGTTGNKDGITEVSFQLICNASTGIRELVAEHQRSL